MIKASGTHSGEPMILLGLSAKNVKNLMDNKPIVFHGAEIGFQGRIVIIYGKTESDIVGELQKIGIVSIK